MVVYFHNRHVEPLQALIRRLQAEPDLTAAETDALTEISRNVEIETTHAPYRIWLRDQKASEPNYVCTSGSPNPLPLGTDERRYIVKP